MLPEWISYCTNSLGSTKGFWWKATYFFICSIMLPNVQVSALFLHPPWVLSTPLIKLLLIMTAQDIFPFKAQSHTKAYHSLIANINRLIDKFNLELNWDPKFTIVSLRPCPHVYGYFWIRNFFVADSKVSPSTHSVFKSYSPVHTYPMVSGFTLVPKAPLH